MKNQELIIRLNTIDEEIGFLEEISKPDALIEEKLEELRTLRHEIEKEIHYDQVTTAPANQEGC